MAFSAEDEQPITQTFEASSWDEFVAAATSIENAGGGGNYIISLKSDIFILKATVEFRKANVITILGNGHSIINNSVINNNYHYAFIRVYSSATLNLGSRNGSDTLGLREPNTSRLTTALFAVVLL